MTRVCGPRWDTRWRSAARAMDRKMDYLFMQGVQATWGTGGSKIPLHCPHSTIPICLIHMLFPRHVLRHYSGS